MSMLREVNRGIGKNLRSWLLSPSRNRSVSRMVILLVGSFALFAILAPRVFFNPLNLQNIALAAPEIGVIAIGMMLAMLTGGIDLSIVSIASLSAISISTLFTAVAAGSPQTAESMGFLIMLVGPAIGLIAGLINGVLIAYVGITPILATLGTMQVFNGIALAWTGGRTLYGSPAGLTAFGQGTLLGVPLLFVVFMLVAVAAAVVVNRTPIGLSIQLQGANPTAAMYSGIKSVKVLMATYIMTGLIGGIAGVLFIARNPTASADYGTSYVLLVIVIAVLGGTNPNGGFATVTGVVLATLTLQVVSSGFTALRLSPYQYAIAQGVILIGVMIIDQVDWSRLRSIKKQAPEVLGDTAELSDKTMSKGVS